jgi:hypothetical protein
MYKCMKVLNAWSNYGPHPKIIIDKYKIIIHIVTGDLINAGYFFKNLAYPEMHISDYVLLKQYY